MATPFSKQDRSEDDRSSKYQWQEKGGNDGLDLKIDPKNDSNVVLGGRWESGVTHEVRK